MTPALEARGLCLRFGETEALRGVDLTVAQGEMFALVGPDGAGKSTLLRLACGLLEPTAGSLRILGLDPARYLEDIKRRIGYFSQGFTLYGDLSVDENLEFFAEIHGVPRYRERREQLLEFTRLAPFRGRLADRLSGGMKQKLALACTLIHRPALLLLDEPTTGVDPVSRRDFWVILGSLLDEGITILLTTPYLDEAERATRVGLLQDGRLLDADTPTALRAGLPGRLLEVACSDVRRAFALLERQPGLGEIQIFGDRLDILLAGRAGEPEGEEPLRELLEAEGIRVTACRSIQPRLENVFISRMRAERGEHAHG
jgi:ABC-2 type transport system ATP-binding protein